VTHAPSSATHPLICHPASPCPLPLRIGVRLSAAVRDTVPGLLLQYEVQGDTRRLRLPAPAAPGPADGLWQHTCLEAFVGVVGDSAYREFNFSPSGQWAAYRFSGPRQRDTAAESVQGPVRPHLDLELTPHRLSLQAWLPAQALPAPSAAWDIGLTAVIETADGQLSYWALQHPAARPDFHHRGGWQALPELPALLSTDPTP
jgi:hypothetical protein